MATTKPKAPNVSHPRIPERYLDVPSQRLFYLSLGLLSQAIKIIDFLQYLLTPEDVSTTYGRKWLIFDFTYCAVLSQLNIPRLSYSKTVVLLQIISLWIFDGLLFGGVSLNMTGFRSEPNESSHKFHQPDIPATPQQFQLSDVLGSFGFGMFQSTPYGLKDTNLRGQHTVRMSPINTARLNPQSQALCLAGSSLLIPLLLNNTNVASVKYSLTPLGRLGTGEEQEPLKSSKVEYFEVNAKELKAIEHARDDGLQLTRPFTSPSNDVDDYDEDDEDDMDTTTDGNGVYFSLQKTQSLVHLRVSKPGIIRLERVLDISNTEARLVQPTDLVIVECPTAEFAHDPSALSANNVQCAGEDLDLQLAINLKGVPPLSLRWIKAVDGKREEFLVEGIESEDNRGHPRSNAELTQASSRRTLSQDVRVPLTVSLDVVGSHSYVLEEVVDGLGNVVRLRQETSNSDSRKHGDDERSSSTGTHASIARSFTVLRRPNMSFRYCRAGNPVSLLVGSQAQLTAYSNGADPRDGPWEVTIGYLPSIDGGLKKGASKKDKVWPQIMKTPQDKKDLTFSVDAPGDYTILAMKGKYCNGDILAPDTCRVVEKMLPIVEIEWKKIHECSGDTGVSASLVLHGTPPFKVYYRSQKDKENAREHSKTFSSSRGELTLQPERSGHYVYTFTQISDANYQMVPLDGPSIDQVVHTLAAADFAHSGLAARSKRVINSCSGDQVDIDVELKGTSPWNLAYQVVGPKSSETTQITSITSPHTTLRVPIPAAIDKDGGSFEVNLVSVEDSYGCKRPISVPGISVTVKRIKATAKFYGMEGKRNVTVLEREWANLPLRLTGDGPWSIKYRRMEEPERILMVELNNPNDHLRVNRNGLFEIIEVADSQCPGSVFNESSTYRVDWVPRPSATLSPLTQAMYEPFNGSYILPPICEGDDDHVDLELTGKPPFQILYNVAQNTGTGGTRILDQPTFSSIQSHARFQLHSSSTGRMYYEVKQIGDASYPLAVDKQSVVPRSQRLLFEQEVSMRPTARFRNTNRLSYCLHDPFVPRDTSDGHGVVLLEGTPPFQLRVSVKQLAVSQKDTILVDVTGSSWQLNLPSYKFLSIGPHLITIESVADASHCGHAPLEQTSIWVDVAETAAIIPIDHRENYCVGDVSLFQMEGLPPWTIGYRINGKSYTQAAKASPFSMLQQQPGEFTITSIAHQQQMCKAVVTDLRFAVHPLPSAHLGHGKDIQQDIHEGDQAEIVFRLFGEPPFTFTYQRSEPSTKKGKSGKVLETHTVSGVTSHEYSIYSALEGTWTVTSITDRYCRYPSAKPDSIGHRQKP